MLMYEVIIIKGFLVLLKDMMKNKVNWKIGCVVNLIVGKDGVIRGYKFFIGNGYVVERFFQLLCDLEISGVSDDFGLLVEDVEYSGGIIEIGVN